MTLGQPIQIRLSPEKQSRYEAEASDQNLPLATYLRQRLENTDVFFEEIAALRDTIAQAQAKTKKNTLPGDTHQSSSPTAFSVQIEMLLLLRSLVNPQKLNIVHSELRRLGLNVWEAENEEISS